MSSPLDAHLLNALSDLTTEYLNLDEIIRLKLPLSDSVLRSKMAAYDVNALMAPQDPNTDPRELSSHQHDAVAAAVLLGENIPGLADHLTELSQFPTSTCKIVLSSVLTELTPERVIAWARFQHMNNKHLNRSLTKRIIRAVLRHTVVGTDESIVNMAGLVKSMSLMRMMIRHGIKPHQILGVLNADSAFQAQVWSLMLQELPPRQIMEALTKSIQSPLFSPQLLTLTLASTNPALFEPLPGQNILTVFMERRGNYLVRLLHHPQFNPAHVVDFLIGSPMYVRWIPGLTRLFESPQVQSHSALIKSELPRLIEYARSLKRTQVVTLLENLMQRL